MKNYFNLFLLLVLCCSCSAQKEIAEHYETETYKKRMAYFAENPLHEGLVVFFGNSITQAGDWAVYFPDADVANRGISGDNTEGMLARLDEIVAAKPRKFFIMAGINDISLSRSNKTISRNYEAIVRTLKSESPETEIIIQSVLPINNTFAQYSRLKGKETQILSLNRMLHRLAKKNNLTFINLFPHFTDSEGRLKKEFTSDGLHLNHEAYSLWVQIIRLKVD